MSGTTTFGYGPELETTTVTTSAGTYTSSYDAEKRRVALAYPAGSAVGRFRYAEGRLPLEETLAAGSLAWTGDNVLFGGSPVAQVGTLVNPNYGPTAFHLHTDRMGLVRKISTTSGARLKRYISDAWGASSYSGGDEVIDSAASPNPIWNWRYPGQYVDAGGVYNEGWRDYIPDLGQFTGPDPLAMGTSYEHFGAQAYGYAAGEPFAFTDPDGRAIDPNALIHVEPVPGRHSGGGGGGLSDDYCEKHPTDPECQQQTTDDDDQDSHSTRGEPQTFVAWTCANFGWFCGLTDGGGSGGGGGSSSSGGGGAGTLAKNRYRMGWGTKYVIYAHGAPPICTYVTNDMFREVYECDVTTCSGPCRFQVACPYSIGGQFNVNNSPYKCKRVFSAGGPFGP